MSYQSIRHISLQFKNGMLPTEWTEWVRRTIITNATIIAASINADQLMKRKKSPRIATTTTSQIQKRVDLLNHNHTNILIIANRSELSI